MWFIFLQILEVGPSECAGATLYSTVYPCLSCAKMIVERGIQEVIYDREYNSDLTEKILTRAGVKMVKYEETLDKFI